MNILRCDGVRARVRERDRNSNVCRDGGVRGCVHNNRVRDGLYPVPFHELYRAYARVRDSNNRGRGGDDARDARGRGDDCGVRHNKGKLRRLILLSQN